MDRLSYRWLVGLGAWLALVGSVGAQTEPTARLGLSAVPDGYVDHLEPEVGLPFTLYVVLTGLNDGEPLAFQFQEVSWVVHTVCCGDSPVGVVAMVHAPGIAAQGDPYEVLESTALDCPDGDTVLLATVTFDWLLEGETSFPLSAGAITAALACDGEAHLLQTLLVAIDGQEPSPVETMTWTRIKALFGAGEVSP